MAEVSTDAVKSLLDTIDFPASKEEIVRYAETRSRAGDESVVKALRALPLGDYTNRDEVLRSIESVEATGQTPSTKARQARDSSHEQVAEHLRRTRT